MIRRTLAAAGILLAAAAPLAAQGTPWHIVRPGETLEQIASRYLGSIQLWQELHRLNPGIADPNRIEPGQRIRLPTMRPVLPAATVDRLSRQVEEQPSPIPWKEAQVGDVLVERDGVRTYRKSSAELRFADGARLTVTEDSLVFLRRSGAAPAAPASAGRKAIEIVDGQADLEARAGSGAAGAAAPEVEIVVAGARATARPDRRSGASQTRARRAPEGAKLMVYDGDGDVESGGAKVAVPRGMGTSVPENAPPSPPEPLLPAPARTDPAADAERACADPVLSWEPVAGAAAYIVEVCRDPGCGALVERQTGVAAPPWRPMAPLPLGELYWRVTARSASGLDGYPAAASRLTVTSDRTGLQPPTGSLAVGGPQVRVGDTLFTSAAATVQVTAADAAGSPARWVPMIGGREAAALPAAWEAGPHTVGALASDGCGNRAEVAPVTFVADTAAPVIRWQVGDRKALSDRLADDSEKERRRLRGRRGSGKPATDAWQTQAGVWQLPLPWVKRRDDQVYARFPVEIRSDRPQAFLAAPDTGVSADGRDDLLDDQVLWIAADDAGAGVETLVLKDRREGDHPDQVVLEVEATDMVGNVSRKEIVLRKR